VRCKGARLLCGLPRCPLISARSSIGGVGNVDGSSPPSIFVGRLGYPYINLYPATPPMHGDTSIFEEPRDWLSLGLEDFLSLRLSLIRGSLRFRVRDATNPPGLLAELQALALSTKPVDVELRLRGPVRGVEFNEYSPPLGPWAPLGGLWMSNPSPHRVLEEAHGDTDLGAEEAIWAAYRSGLDVHVISRALSVGALGIGRRRRLVPTRWSITAVDKVVSDELLSEVKDYPLIDEYRVYVRRSMGNTFVALLVPHTWIYEWGEAWFPGSTWNPGNRVELEIDWEGYRGRSGYPAIGGCYYAARLAVLEHLASMRRQAGALLWREIGGGFRLPVGVWYVRENLRAMFRERPLVFHELGEALRYASAQLSLGELWVRSSRILGRLVAL
jgi:hypothetical protein